MNDTIDKIVWSPQSEQDLDNILKYYQEFSPDYADKHIISIINSVSDLIFSKQFQVDEYDPSSRRLFVKKKFRVIYKVVGKIILITRVYPTQKNPEGIRK